MPTHHLETGDGPGDELAGSSHLVYQLCKSSKGRQFRISPPNKEDDDNNDLQRARPMLLSKYRAQRVNGEVVIDFPKLSASGEQTGQNVLDDSREDKL